VNFKIEGVIPAVVTPLKKGEKGCDLKATEKLIDFLLEKEVNGLFILGSFGEGLLLSIEERKKFTEKVIDYVSRKVPVMVTVSHMELRKAKELIEHAQRKGADAIVSVPPFYYNFSDPGMENYIRGICKDFKNLPVFIYNIPQFTINEVNFSILQNLLEDCPNFAGIKYSKASLIGFQNLLALKGKISLLMGCDKLAYPAFLLGADGIVSGPANAFPEIYVQLYRAVKEKEYEKAKEKQQLINYIIKKATSIMKCSEAEITFYKKALQIRGITVGEVSDPLPSVDSLEEEAISSLVKEVIQADKDGLPNR